MAEAALTKDRFLGGRPRLYQPAQGVRAGSDAVLLAAAVAAKAGESALDVGCGVGPAALCLACRVAGVRVTGLEIQPGASPWKHCFRPNINGCGRWRSAWRCSFPCAK